MDDTSMEVLEPNQVLSLRSKWTLTSAIYLCYFIYGMGVNFVGPAILDLADQISSDVDHISSTSLVTAAVAYTICSIGGGILCRYVNRQWFLITCIIVCGAMNIWMPLTNSLLTLTFCLAIAQAFGSGIDIATNAWLLALWRNSASTHLMQGLHFSWALGSAVAPLVIAPFLSVRNDTLTNGTKISDGIAHGVSMPMVLYDVSNHSEPQMTGSESEIYVIYYMSASLYALVAAIFIALYFIVPYSESNEETEMEANTTTDGPSYLFSKQARVLIIFVAIVIICFDAGAEMATFDYNTAMIVGLGFTKKTGAYIASARASMFTFARAVVFFLSMKIQIKIILMFHMVLLLIANFILAFASMQQNILSTPMSASAVETMLWIGFSLMGYGFGPIYPGTISFTEKYVKLSSFVCGLFVAVGGINIVLNLAVVGKFLEAMPIILIYNVLIAAIVIIVMFIAIMVIVKRTGKIVSSETE